MEVASRSSVQKKSWRFARWPLFFALNGAFFFVIGISTVRETYRAWQIDQDIRGLEQQVNALEGKKSHLLTLVERLNHPDELDREARSRLGLRKPGERVFAVPEDILKETSANSVEDASSTGASVALSNPAKWLRYFFKP